MNKNAIALVIAVIAVIAALILVGSLIDPLGLRDREAPEVKTAVETELQENIEALSGRIDGLQGQVEKVGIPDKTSESVYQLDNETEMTVKWTQRKIEVAHHADNDKRTTRYWPGISEENESLLEYTATKKWIVLDWETEKADFYDHDYTDWMSAQFREVVDNGEIPKTTIK